VLVNAQGHGVLVEVVHRVKVLQECVADQKQVLVLAWKSALVNYEVTFIVRRLVEVLLWVNLEHVVAHLKTHWLQLRGNCVTRLSHVAEGLIGGAVQVRDRCAPLVFNFVEHVGRDR